MRGRSVAQAIRADVEPGYDSRAGERYDSAQDNLARFIVYFGPYILWGSLGAAAGVILLIAS